jgi:hypothetical protein
MVTAAKAFIGRLARIDIERGFHFYPIEFALVPIPIVSAARHAAADNLTALDGMAHTNSTSLE